MIVAVFRRRANPDARVGRFADLVETGAGPAFAALRRSELIGRPLGSTSFVRSAEARLGRKLRPAKRGRKPRGMGSDQ